MLGLRERWPTREGGEEAPGERTRGGERVGGRIPPHRTLQHTELSSEEARRP